ncbi:MAG: radical SAM protein, partial [Bacillota bacterium]|nr:radical SAM protein [Bacillota bacterium]
MAARKESIVDKQIRYHFLKEIADHNILALTSRCNVKCCFCSHGNNPQGTKVYMSGSRDVEEIVAALDFLDPHRDIIIGESASPVCEGEPFLVKGFQSILEAIRKKFPHTMIRITTNGTFLTTETVRWLRELRPIYINLSLNSVSHRERIMKDHSDIAVNAPILLNDAGIPFQGSVVLMPELTGWDDIEDTLSYLHGNGAELVRLLMPGYSYLAPEERRYDWELRRNEAMVLIKGQPGVTLLEPPYYTGNEPIIYGILPDSAASRMDLRKGDKICAVNGELPLNRYDAWRMIAQRGFCDLLIRRGEHEISVILEKTKGDCGGIVFLNDLDPLRLERMAAFQCQSTNQGHGVIFCSQLGRPYLEANLPLFPELGELELVTVKNHYFGGNIGAAGLLTVGDYEKAAAKLKLDYAFLPAESFNSKGK